jgi:hypothetical protein
VLIREIGTFELVFVNFVEHMSHHPMIEVWLGVQLKNLLILTIQATNEHIKVAHD